jgi:hypothetical protein
MSILPSFALFVILQSWSLVLHLVSELWYERQQAHYSKHWLVRLEEILDFSPLEEGCAPFHANNGRGKPVIHTTSRLVRALLVRYLYALSLRDTEEMIDNHLLIKRFVGYNLFETPLDHSTLNRFELWVFKHQPRLFFDEIIHLIDRLCPEDRQRLQLVDTFGLQARAAKTCLITLIRDVCRKILRELAAVDPQRHADLSAALDLIALFGAEDEKITPALKGKERGERLQLVAQQALRLLRLLNDSLDQTPFLSPDEQLPLRFLLAALTKIIEDECKVVSNSPDDPNDVTITERKHGQKGSYRIGAAADPEATYRDHGAGSETILGYNATVIGTATFVRETRVDTGSRPDNMGLPDVLQSQYEHQGFFPSQVAGDMAYGHGKTRALVDELTDGQTQIIALVPDYSKGSDLYSPKDFTLSDDGLSLTCPNNITTHRRYVTKNKGGADFRFPAKVCRDCPLWDKCRGPEGKKSVLRNVFISFYRPQLDAALVFNQTDAFKQGIKKRMNIERIIYNLTNIHGARKAHSYGQERTDFQLKMQATAFNLRQLVRQMAKKKPAQGAVRPVAA